MKKILGLLIFISGAAAHAQEFGFSAGFHSSNAEVSTAGASAESKVGFRLGVPIAFELVEPMKFKTGVGYTQRHFDIKSGTTNFTAKMNYIDIPALVQYNFNEMFGMFGGLTMALNVGKNIEGGGTTTKADGAEAIVPLATVGASLIFNDMIGFDFCYERGIGDIATDIKDYSVFGANFIYWMY